MTKTPTQSSLIPFLKEFSKKILYSAILGITSTLVFCFLYQNAFAYSDVLIENPKNNQEISHPNPKISGSVEKGVSVVSVFFDEKKDGEAVVVDGKFEYLTKNPLSSGDHSVRVVATQDEGADFSEISSLVNFYIIPNPSPTILYPTKDTRIGSDRFWVGGVSKNDSDIIVYIDGVELANISVKNHVSGTGSFGVEILGVEPGEHVVFVVAIDKYGKKSFQSSFLSVFVENPTPAPILFNPVINSDSGIERPFIVGLAKNGLDVSIVLDDKVVGIVKAFSENGETGSFAWQPKDAFALGLRKIEAFASDGGKLSNNSNVIKWQVGYVPVSEVQDNKDVKDLENSNVSVDDKTQSQDFVVVDKQREPDGGVSVSNTENKETLTIKSELLESELGEEAGVEDDSGRIMADDDYVFGDKEDLGLKDENNKEVSFLAPGAVVRNVDDSTENTTSQDANNKIQSENEKTTDKKFTFNTSLVMGVIILIFLFISVLMWYIQEKKDELSDRVASIFKEEDVAEDFKKEQNSEYVGPGDASFGAHFGVGFDDKNNASVKKEENKDDLIVDFEDDEELEDKKEDMPPPPPPMF